MSREKTYRDLAEHLKQDEQGLELASKFWKACHPPSVCIGGAEEWGGLMHVKKEAELKAGIMMWSITYRQRVTFYLHPDAQGIISADHAQRIAASILGVDDPESIGAYLVEMVL